MDMEETSTTPTDFLDQEPSKQEKAEVRIVFVFWGRELRIQGIFCPWHRRIPFPASRTQILLLIFSWLPPTRTPIHLFSLSLPSQFMAPCGCSTMAVTYPNATLLWMMATAPYDTLHHGHTTTTTMQLLSHLDRCARPLNHPRNGYDYCVRIGPPRIQPLSMGRMPNLWNTNPT